MNEKEYLDRIFNPYAQTQELLDLKEEISTNLNESFMDNLKEGMNREEAFQKSIEDLGAVEQMLSEFPKKKEAGWKWFYYISICCIVVGLCISLFTFADHTGWDGAFLALGSLYPFCIVQTAYIIWYKIGKGRITLWNNLAGIFSCVLLFLILNLTESMFRVKYYYGAISYDLQSMMGEIVLAVVAFGITIFALYKSKSLQVI